MPGACQSVSVDLGARRCAGARLDEAATALEQYFEEVYDKLIGASLAYDMPENLARPPAASHYGRVARGR